MEVRSHLGSDRAALLCLQASRKDHSQRAPRPRANCPSKRMRVPGTFLLGTLVLSRPRSACAFVSRASLVRGASSRRMHMRSISCVAPPLMPVESAEPLAGGNALADGLKLLNSLSQKTEPFKPIDPRLVKWYVCGPTVYDSAHVGHARNYVAFDIVRRILSDYFGFDILYVMNITDIDDKIILRTHRIHLEALVDQLAAVDCTTTLNAARGAAEAVLAAAKPELSELIEAQRQLTAAAAADGIELAGECAIKEEFLQLTSAFEVEFFDDLAALNVLQPDAITRVSDYLPEIIAYIERILENGYCYESNGSVYFDTNAFANAPDMTYGKLDPSKVSAGQMQGNRSPTEADAAAEADDWTEGKSTAELLAEGEGALSAAAAAEKRHPADFVLWKASKLGEPAWPSPWGDGRPGWHIECSAMASDMLGDRVDLNSGGVDLKFPHHENQIAQAEAHFNCCSWVNYFLHSGHLKIEGLKMSKSLKNFITIRGALEQYSSAQLRFLFLLRRFSEPMEYSENTLAAAADLERRFATFGTALGARLKDASSLNAAGPAAAVRTAGAGGPPVPARAAIHKWGEEERKLHGVFVDRRAAVHAALLDSIDTPTALKALEQLIRATNVYMAEVSDVGRGATLLARVQRYFTGMMSTFGVTPAASASAASTTGGASAEQVVDALSAFRDGIRQRAIDRIRAKPKGGGAEGGGEADGKAVAEQILEACDELRDEVLPSLGIQLDDRPSGVAQITFGDPKLLQAEAARKAEQAAELAAEKDAKAAAKEAAKAKEAALAMIPPAAMFAAEHDAAFEREGPSYTKLDDNGLPTETDDGEPVSKSMRKKLTKQQTKHAKLHAAFLEKQSST